MRALLLSILLIPGSVLATEQIRCPDTYPSNDTVIARPAKWNSAVVLGNQPLISAGMLTGPIEIRGDLRGQEKKIDNGHEIRYRFDRIQHPPEKWVQCSYGDGGAIRLVKRVRDDTTECILTLTRAALPGVPKITVICE